MVRVLACLVALAGVTLLLPSLPLPPAMLAAVIASIISAVLCIALTAAVMRRRFDEQHLLYATALQNVSQGVVMFDADGRLLLANERYRQMYALSAEQAKPGRSLREILQYRRDAGAFDRDPETVAAAYVNGALPPSKEMKLPDGRVILFHIQRRPGGGWVSTHEDITELRQREASFRLVFESNPVPMWINDRDNLRFLDVNSAAVEHYGYSREQFLEMTLLDIRPSEDWEELRSAVGDRSTRAAGRIRRHRKADGSKIEASIYNRPLSFAGHDAVLVAAIDVTARKLVEDELRRTRTFLYNVIDNVPAIVSVKDVLNDYSYVLVNRKCEEYFGLSRHEIIGRNVYDLFERSKADILQARDRELERCGEQSIGDERPVHSADGDIEFINTRRTVIQGDDGKPRYLLTIIDNITERKRAENELHRASELMQAVIDASPVAITGSTPSGEMIIWNRAAEDLFGYMTEEAIGRRAIDLIVPDDMRAEFTASRAKAFSGEVVRNLVERRKRKDGTIIDVQLASAPVFNEDGSVRACVVAIEDITNHKMLEEQLRQSQKMEAIGQLTGGLSHDFNNLLAIIIGNLDLLREQVGWNPDASEAVEEALGASLRGADLNRRLLAFARRQPLQPKNVDLSDLVTGMTRLLERTLGEHIEINLSTGSDVWPVLVDPAQLESALTNLVVNARDAMPGGGRLTIGTRNIFIDRDYANVHSDVTAGDYVVLEVSDTGTGMPPEVIVRVFEPFFTTKGKEKGTGLGLSMVFGFVKQSGGHVQVYSEVGIGTTLRLYLPRSAEATAEERPQAVNVLPRGHETVLAVEDNPGLRLILVKQLQDLGYRVLQAENAKSAIEILNRDETIDLLFTDIVLPGGVNGADLARAAEGMRSNLKVLFTSGFPEAAFGPNGALPQGATLLGKPYRKEDLAVRLRETLVA